MDRHLLSNFTSTVLFMSQVAGLSWLLNKLRFLHAMGTLILTICPLLISLQYLVSQLRFFYYHFISRIFLALIKFSDLHIHSQTFSHTGSEKQPHVYKHNYNTHTGHD